MKLDKDPSLDDWMQYIQSVHHRSIEMSLDRIRMVYDRLLPAGPGFALIQVGGTNGKGSCTELLASILQAGGYRVGAYTSPHVLSFNERFRVDGIPALDSDIAAALARVDDARGDTPLTYFEFSTLAAFLLFYGENIDIAVMEVGMGGRLDAVNLLPGVVSLITNISLDHIAWLGDTRDRIAYEKAGLIHPGIPVVIGDADPPAVLEERAVECHSPCHRLGRDFGYDRNDTDDLWSWWSAATQGSKRLSDLPPPLGGWDVQYANAACVLQVLDCIKDSFPVTGDDCREGLRRASIFARSQLLHTSPHVLVDVGHNPAALATLRSNIESLDISGRVYGIFSMLEDKDVAECATVMSGVIDSWYVTQIDDERALPLDVLERHVRHTLSESKSLKTTMEILTVASPAAALEMVLERLTRQDCLVVFGSFHIVGDIIPRLRRVGIFELESKG